MNNGEISVTQALNHIQSWLNAGDYDKVIQGCQEILMLEPGNQRALTLMKQAQEKRNDVTMPEEPAPATPDPLEELQVEEAPKGLDAPAPESMERAPEPQAEYTQDHLGGPIEKKKLFLALTVPAAMVVIIGGGIIWFLANQKRNNQIAEVVDEPEIEEPVVDEPEEDLSYLDHNDERVVALTNMGKVIEDFHDENDRYPEADEVIDLLIDSKYFSEVPEDPRQGENDNDGAAYGYVYAYYEDYYSISALFEDSRGKGYPWNRGANPKHFPDFRDWEEDHVLLIGEE